jgi:hypothetical protein
MPSNAAATSTNRSVEGFRESCTHCPLYSPFDPYAGYADTDQSSSVTQIFREICFRGSHFEAQAIYIRLNPPHLATVRADLSLTELGVKAAIFRTVIERHKCPHPGRSTSLQPKVNGRRLLRSPISALNGCIGREAACPPVTVTPGLPPISADVSAFSE